MRLTDHKPLALLYGATARLPARRLPADAAAALAAGLAGPADRRSRRRSSARPTRPGGILLPEFYYQLVSMHGSVMIFLAVVPLATGGFGGYLVPLHDRRPRPGVPAAERARLRHLPGRPGC